MVMVLVLPAGMSACGQKGALTLPASAQASAAASAAEAGTR